jgi:chromosome partitioning protein
MASGDPKLGPTGRPVVTFPVPAPPHTHGPARVIALCNQKGGVGKTTSTINLGAALAEYGRRVLLLDFDPQGALTAGVGFQPHELDLTVYNMLVDRHVTADDLILETNVPGMDLLPANIDLSAAEVALVNEVAREQVLARAIAPVLDRYDIVLIDCQPSLGLLTVNALAAADGVIVPMSCEYFALRGMALLVETIGKVQDRINPRLAVDGILATMYNARTLHHREALSRVVEAFGDDVFRTVITPTIKFPDATVARVPITEYAPSSPGAESYRQLARELLFRLGAEPMPGQEEAAAGQPDDGAGSGPDDASGAGGGRSGAPDHGGEALADETDDAPEPGGAPAPTMPSLGPAAGGSLRP